MRKKSIILLIVVLITITGCSQGNDKPVIGNSTSLSDNDIKKGNDSISDIDIKLVKEGQELAIDDKEYILKLVESSVDKNHTTLNLAISDDNINKFKKDGLVIDVKYKNNKNLYLGDSTTTYLVNSIYFLINDEEQLIMIHSGEDTVVMEIPHTIVEEILGKYKIHKKL